MTAPLQPCEVLGFSSLASLLGTQNFRITHRGNPTFQVVLSLVEGSAASVVPMF